MHSPYMKKVPGGKRAVLCIHGFLGSPAHFKPFYDAVPEEMSVYSLLLDGHGGTTKDFGASSMEKWQTQVKEGLTFLSDTYEEIYIIGHSMGTLLAITLAPLFPKIRGLFLLAVPLKIRVGLGAVQNSLKAYFGKHREEDAVGKAYAAAHSVTLSKNPFSYIAWLPRYLDLFRLSKKTREDIKNISLPCRIFQSEKDELVSARSALFIPKKENFTVLVLPSGRHFIYTAENTKTLKTELHLFLKGEEA